MARRFIVLIWAALLLGCSSLTNILVVNESSSPMTVQAEFIDSTVTTTKQPMVITDKRTLRPGESMVAVEHTFSPQGELIVHVDGKRTERFPIKGSSGGGEIYCRIQGTTIITSKSQNPITRMFLGLIFFAATVCAIIFAGWAIPAAIRKRKAAAPLS